jgi:hypothetical protein
MNFLKLVLLSTVVPVMVHAQNISTIAGTGTQGYIGDGGPASAANLHVYKIVMDKEGNIYASQPMEYVIRRIDKATGIITTVAGNGTQGFAGDGGLAVDAQFDKPASIALNAQGDLFVYDNLRIRKIDKATGIITTIAGTGVSGYAGDGGDALQAQFAYDDGNVVVDTSGNILVNDAGNYRIRKIDATTNVINTIAGVGTFGGTGDGGPATAAQIEALYMMYVDRHNNIYLSMSNSHAVRKIDAVTGIITLVAGGGPMGCAGDGNPAVGQPMTMINGICTDKDDNFYLSDGYCSVIRKVDGVTNIIQTIAGTLAANSGSFSGDGGPAINATLKYNNSVIMDTCGNIYISDQGNNRIRKITMNSGCEPTTLKLSDVSSAVYSVYPNPASSSVTVTASEKIRSVMFCDVTGRTVLNTTGDSEKVNIDISNLGIGIYFVNVNGVWKTLVKE